MRSFVDGGGAIAACQSCRKIHQLGGLELCPISTMADLYALVHECDKIVPSKCFESLTERQQLGLKAANEKMGLQWRLMWLTTSFNAEVGEGSE